MEALPALSKMVFNDQKKSELISALVETSGSMEKVNAVFQMQEERGNHNAMRKKALRFTKKQMRDAYGDDADKVMKHKEENDMVEDDENCPGTKVYLVAQKEDEHEEFSRSSAWDYFFVRYVNVNVLKFILFFCNPRAICVRWLVGDITGELGCG